MCYIYIKTVSAAKTAVKGWHVLECGLGYWKLDLPVLP